jgi:hypothetical protein
MPVILGFKDDANDKSNKVCRFLDNKRRLVINRTKF